jgi:hypothetical protein
MWRWRYFVLVVVAAAAMADRASAQDASVKAVFEKYNLVGIFAQDCSKPAAADNFYFVHRALDDGHVQRDLMDGPTSRKFVFLFDKASGLGPGEIALSGTRDGVPISLVWRTEANRHVEVETTLNGSKVIADGKFISNGKPVPWLNRCAAPG